MRNAKQWFGIILGMVMLFLLTGCAPGPTPGPTPSPTPGEMEKDFTLPTVEDESFTLGDHLGRPIVLSFFVPACGGCQQQIPHLNSIHEKYKDTENLLVLGVGVGTMQRIASYVAQRGIEYTAVVDETQDVARDYGVSSVPRTFFVNRLGQIVSSSQDGRTTALTLEELEQYLQEIL